MNKTNNINIGRTPFIITEDAYLELTNYLSAVSKRIDNSEVLEEIEYRVAELLIEEGLGADKIVLASDIEHIQAELGQPSDFADEDKPKESNLKGRKLYRNQDTAVVGGVVSGLANYFGLDVTLVRIAVIVLFFMSWGTILVAYVLMWIITPIATSSSEKLQMEGQVPTIENIANYTKNLVKYNPDAPTLAQRIHSLLKFSAKVLAIMTGLFIIIMTTIGLISALAGGIYYLLNPSNVFGGLSIFPINYIDYGFIASGLLLGFTGCILLYATGIALIERKWRLPLWSLILMTALLIISMASTIGFGSVAIPKLAERIDNAQVTEIHADIINLSKIGKS